MRINRKRKIELEEDIDNYQREKEVNEVVKNNMKMIILT